MKKSLLLCFLLSNTLIWADKREIKALTTIPFLSQTTCGKGFPCYKITPDSKGLLVLNAQGQLQYFDVEKGDRKKISDTNCSRKTCFAMSPDSSTVVFTKLENEES